jgi:hypothetical protein
MNARLLRRLLAVALVVLIPVAVRAAATDPLPEPAEMRPLIDAAGGADDHAGADLVTVFERTDSDVEPSGLSHVVRHELVKVLTPAGALTLGRQRFDYDPASQYLEIRRVRIHRRGGGVEDIDPAAAADVTQPMHMIYWGARMRCLQLPRLEPGDAVELATYRKGFMIAYLTGDQADDESRYIPPMRGHWYDVQLFQAGRPMLEKTVTVRTPRDKPLQYRIYNGAVFAETAFDDSTLTYRFWQQDCPALPTEWRRADPQDFAPKVVMATVADWQAKSRWFWEVNTGQFDSNEEIDALVADITDGLKTDEEKVHALNHWSAMNIRYCGLNMGEGEGYVLHPGDMILRERSGVCKDIAGMAITLCRAAGYEVYPAMTMAGSRVEAIPADQFNHCVGAWRKPDGAWHMLDPTWIPFSRYDWSRAEGGQHYVIGTPWGEELAMIPPYAAAENRLTVTVRGRIDPDGTVAGKLRLEGEGQADTRLRRTLGQSARSDRERGLRAWLASLAPGAQLTRWRAGDPQDWNRPMTVELEFRLPDHAALSRRVCVWKPVAAGLALHGYGGAVRITDPPALPEERTTPAMLWWPQELVLDEEIELPRGFALRDEGRRWTAGDDDAFAACDIEVSADGRRVRHAGRFRYDDRQVATDQWSAFRAAVTTLQDAAGARLVAVKEGK